MSKPKLFLFGGFLGSGKTTLLTTLGEELTRRGARVAVITNDQGDFLVDTEYARSLGLAAGEVLKGCFCCNFGSFVENIEQIMESVDPDYILAEPVGSCTDLTSTVVNPLVLYHRTLVDLCGFYVLADAPRTVSEYAEMSLSDPVSPREVLLSHQLKEAASILLSKTDLLDAGGLAQAESLLSELNPGAEVRRCSSLTGQGIPELVEELMQAQVLEGGNPVALDYELYAAAEAEMGWYNGYFRIASDSEFLPADIVTELLINLKGELRESIVHGKVLAATEHGSVKLSLVAGRMQSDSAIETTRRVRTAACTVNLRSTTSPRQLSEAVGRAVEELSGEFSLEISEYREDALIPAPPSPTHRITREGSRV